MTEKRQQALPQAPAGTVYLSYIYCFEIDYCLEFLWWLLFIYLFDSIYLVDLTGDLSEETAEDVSTEKRQQALPQAPIGNIYL